MAVFLSKMKIKVKGAVIQEELMPFLVNFLIVLKGAVCHKKGIGLNPFMKNLIYNIHFTFRGREFNGVAGTP